MRRQLQAARRFLSLLVLRCLVAILWIEEDRDAGERGNELLEKLKPFARQIGRKCRSARSPCHRVARCWRRGCRAGHTLSQRWVLCWSPLWRPAAPDRR